MCVANKKWPSAEHTQTHMQGEEAAWQELTDSGRATVPVGWVRVGIKPKPGRMTSELYTSPTQPTGHASAKLTHTEEHTACCVVLLLTPWNCPLLCQALHSKIPVESVGRWRILETFGCYETWGWVTETNKYFPEATQEGMGVEGLLLHSSHHFILHKVYVYAQMCECKAR